MITKLSPETATLIRVTYEFAINCCHEKCYIYGLIHASRVVTEATTLGATKEMLLKANEVAAKEFDDMDPKMHESFRKLIELLIDIAPKLGPVLPLLVAMTGMICWEKRNNTANEIITSAEVFKSMIRPEAKA